MKEFSYEEIKSSTKDFSLDALIGKGSHGYVYRAILKDGKHVAVKKPSQIGVSKLDNEIKILSSIENHPNLVNMLGYCPGPAHNLLITELMPNGSLYDSLHSSQNTPISLPHRMFMALQIARAIESLHDACPSIVHRDIKSANVLLDQKWDARLADFSLAVRVVQGWSSTTVPVPAAGTLGYLDPGYTESEKLGPENDVYSFGVLLLEIVSSRKVMDVGRDPSSIVSWAVPMIKGGQVLDVCNERLILGGEEMERFVGRVLSVAARCVETEEERRPGMREVVGELREVVEGVFRCNSCFYKLSLVWNRCKKKRVSTTTTKIMCKDHLIKDEGDEDEI